MATDVKISQLPENLAVNFHDDDVLPMVDQLAGVTKKISLFELDKRWRALPNGGTVGQVLAKLSNIDGEVQWLTVSKASVGLGNVNNTADIDKPLSDAAITALNGKASVASVTSKADKSYVDTQDATKQDKLPLGVDGDILTLASGTPTWQTPAGSTGSVKYYGDPNTDGSWRQRVDGTLFKTEVRKSGAWILVSEFNSNDV